MIDNCQHILLGCCVNLLDFYRRLGVVDRIRFHREFYFLAPGGRLSILKLGRLPSPLHMVWSFGSLSFLSGKAKLAIARALLAIRREYSSRQDLDRITMLDWLCEKRQPADAVSRFWRPVLVSAVNAELDGMAARHGLQVFRLAFLGQPGSHEMGIPSVPLGELYNPIALERTGGVVVRLRTTVEHIRFEASTATGVEADGFHSADAVVCAAPFERIGGLAPELGLDLTAFRHSPITGIHLWFDRPVTELPYAALLDRTIQWMFNKSEGRYLQLVVSASESLSARSQQEVTQLALAELADFFPRTRPAVLERARVVKELRATFQPVPGLQPARPAAATAFSSFFLAGDWTATGWPATMEGAVRSGYNAADEVLQSHDLPRRYLLPDSA
jgi:zeta-carotene desaturase